MAANYNFWLDDGCDTTKVFTRTIGDSAVNFTGLEAEFILYNIYGTTVMDKTTDDDITCGSSSIQVAFNADDTFCDGYYRLTYTDSDDKIVGFIDGFIAINRGNS